MLPTVGQAEASTNLWTPLLLVVFVLHDCRLYVELLFCSVFLILPTNHPLFLTTIIIGRTAGSQLCTLVSYLRRHKLVRRDKVVPVLFSKSQARAFPNTHVLLSI